MLGNGKMGFGMKWLSLQAVVVLVTFIGISTQCLARCAGLPCHDSQSSSDQDRGSKVPPCHRSHPEPAKAPNHVCQVSLFFIEKQAPAIEKAKLVDLAPVFVEPPFSVHLPVPAYTRRMLARETSPPSASELTFSTVLRI